jgi:hypothetical protein
MRDGRVGDTEANLAPRSSSDSKSNESESSRSSRATLARRGRRYIELESWETIVSKTGSWRDPSRKTMPNPSPPMLPLSRLFSFPLLRELQCFFVCFSACRYLQGTFQEPGEASGNDSITTSECSCCLCLTARFSVRQHGWCVWPRIRTHSGHGATLYLPLLRSSAVCEPPVHAGYFYVRRQGPFSCPDGHEEDD